MIPNSISIINGYKAPLTEVNGDVYVIESPELDVNGIVWQSGTTVRFTFTSGYDSSIYSTSSFLQISGETTKTIHNGVWLITTVNASYLEVTNLSVTDGTDDVASSSPSLGYVTHQDFDPESLSSNQSIPRIGQVRYYSNSDLWFGDLFQEGDCYYNEQTKSISCYNGVNISSSISESYLSVTSNYTLLITDTVIYADSTGGDLTITFPLLPQEVPVEIQMRYSSGWYDNNL